MTAGAVGLIGSELPADDLVIRGMATVTRHARTMTTREKRRGMTVIEDGQPTAGAVTSIAGACCYKVTAGLTGRCGAVMTRRTRARRNRSVIKGRG